MIFYVIILEINLNAFLLLQHGINSYKVSLIHSAYKAAIKKYPGFQNTFKEPPIVAYRRPKNLMSQLAKRRYTNKVTPENIKESKTFISNCFNKSETITNTLWKRQAKIQGGSPTDRSVIYAATYDKCQLMYLGQTQDALNCRFNRHKSDILCYPNQCELPKHFHYGDCSFETDLSVSILEKVKGFLQKYKVDQWIICFNTIYLHGLNMHLSDFGLQYLSLFK